MANTKLQGDLGEALVVVEALKRGYVVSKPIGDNARYDLIVDRKGVLEKIQVKARSSNNGKLSLELYSMCYSSTGDSNNRSRQNFYDSKSFDWIALVDIDTLIVYFIPANECSGLTVLSLRLDPPKNNQTEKIRLAKDYLDW